jgi:hypothetical protein
MGYANLAYMGFIIIVVVIFVTTGDEIDVHFTD